MSRHALAHRQRVLATLAEAAGEAGERTRANANEYELMLVKLHADRRRLKTVQSTERKIAVKRELLPAYAAWCEGVMAADCPRQDEVFMTVLIWTIDTGDFATALPMARHAIAQDLVLPDRFARTTACLIAEEMAETALKHEGAALAADLPQLLACAELVAACDMPDEVRAKLFKACAYAHRAAAAAASGAEPAAAAPAAEVAEHRRQALELLTRALQLHDKCGVKKDIERLERELRASSGGTVPDATAPPCSSSAPSPDTAGTPPA